MEPVTYKPSKTTEFLINLNKFIYICGLPNCWIENLNFSNKFTEIYNKIVKFENLSIYLMILCEYSAFITQKNLSTKQGSDLIMFSLSHTIITGFRVQMAHREEKIRNVVYRLGVLLKELYNDMEVEDEMIKKSKFFSKALMLNCLMSVAMYSISACLKVLHGSTYTTIITAWPDINDTSAFGNVLRCWFNLCWWVHLTRIFAIYTLVICLTVCIGHQFKNLNTYFIHLNDIFDKNEQTHKEKEEKYEIGVKMGIQLHSDTLRTTSDIQDICRDVFSFQIVFIIVLLIVLMHQMHQMVSSDRSFANLLTIGLSSVTILCSTGFFMWNAGDITVEAANLPSAMFSSGWNSCHHETSARVRKLLVIAMMQAQRPVELKAFGIVPLSYQSYVSIVKSSYSVFSVLY